MTGEHWDSATGKNLNKKKDQYIRIQWLVPKEKTISTIITKKRLGRDPSLESILLHWKEMAKKVKARTCPLHKEAIDTKEAYYHFEFYNWEEPKTEVSYDICVKCIRNSVYKQKLDALRTLGKNPSFLPMINCASTKICASFVTSKDKAFNCRHIALKFESILHRAEKGGGKLDLAPILYCKRAHPNNLILRSEKDLDWNVGFAGTAMMLQNMSDRMKNFSKEIKNDPKLRKKATEAVREAIKNYAKSMEEALGIALGENAHNSN